MLSSNNDESDEDDIFSLSSSESLDVPFTGQLGLGSNSNKKPDNSDQILYFNNTSKTKPHISRVNVCCFCYKIYILEQLSQFLSSIDLQ